MIAIIRWFVQLFSEEIDITYLEEMKKKWAARKKKY